MSHSFALTRVAAGCMIGGVVDSIYQRALPRLREVARRLLDGSPRCHDWEHTQRVGFVARLLAREEGADPAVVEYAALLHDIGRSRELAERAGISHAEIGAARVPEILREIGIEDETFIGRVAECVRTHRYRTRKDTRPASPEARVVYDADKLDAMGAIGVGRAFHFAGRLGARVHNRRAEALAAAEYGPEDTAYREFLVKLRHLRETMQTASGKRLAAERHEFMVRFFEQLDREVGGQ